MIFKDILKVFKYYMAYDNSNEENSYLCVPLNSHTASIDWDLVSRFQNLPHQVIPSRIDKMKKVYKAEDWVGKVIQPWYSSNKDKEYVVVKVHEDMTPLSKFPKPEFKSFKDFIEKQYGERVERTDIFMIEVKAITQNLTFFAPGLGKDGARKKASNDYITMFIPELCHNFMFPSDLWVKSKLLPSILHRFKSLLTAEKIRKSLNDFVKVLDVNYSPTKIITYNTNTDIEETELGGLDDSVDLFKSRDKSTHLEDLARDKTPKKIEGKNSLLDRCKSNKFYKRPIDISRSIDDAFIIDFDYAIAYINQQLPDQMRKMSLQNEVMNMDASVMYEESSKRAICDNSLRKHVQILKIKNPKSPEQSEILSAITTAGAADNFNMERVEVLGDAFLKFSISLFLMHKHPSWNEGYLTTTKGQIVSNQNLLYLAMSMNLNIPGMIIPTKFEPNTNWVPPLITVPKNLIKAIREHNLNSRILYDLSLSAEEIEAGCCTSENLAMLLNSSAEPEKDAKYSCDSQCFINKQYVSDKVVADCVEAIIGTTLQSYGISKNFEVLQFFGIINKEEQDPSSVLKEKLVNPRIRANISNREVDQFLVNYEIIENNLGYTFNDRAYLLTALTHPSFPTNRITGCYQQLEFLGDAILDFLITCYIYEQNPDMNPGQLTDLRMSLVNNVTLSCICIRQQFQKHMLFENAALLQAINNFEKFQSEQDYAITSEVRLLRTEDETVAMGDYVDVPKALGDILEALIGAVFLDSNNDLETCWNVIYGLFKDEIHKFSINTPIQVVRELYEYNGANPKFSEPVEEAGIFLVKVTFTCHNQRMEASGFGKNSKQAQLSAAKSALAYLQGN